MNVIIVEDEQLAVERLRLLLEQIDPGIHVMAALEGVGQAVDFLRQTKTAADILLMDIHLADGSAFELFHKVEVKSPVIFTTAYDRYAMDAFKVLSIDYLLKPITLESLKKAIGKMRLLREQHPMPIPDYTQIASHPTIRRTSFRTRFLGKLGQRWFFINTADIAMITVDNRIVHVIAMDKTRYLVDHTLDQLEEELEPSCFFRINRSAIVHAQAIEQVKPFINHRLRLTLKNPLHMEEVIVSRDRVPDFKKWADS